MDFCRFFPLKKRKIFQIFISSSGKISCIKYCILVGTTVIIELVIMIKLIIMIMKIDNKSNDDNINNGKVSSRNI